MSVRKTVDIDDDLMIAIRKIQHEERKSFKQIINELLLMGSDFAEFEQSEVRIDDEVQN
jgi:predicted CopG family antitoxin